MKDQFVTYEIAKAMKELWFNDNCLREFATQDSETILITVEESLQPQDHDTEFTPAPLWQQAIDWLREEHGIEISITGAFHVIREYQYLICFSPYGKEDWLQDPDSVERTYNEARETAILKALELIKK